MNRLIRQSNHWVFPLAAVFLYAAVFLRSIITFRNHSYFIWILVILLIWLSLAVSEAAISRRLSHYFPFYLACETILVFVLLNMPDSLDFFGGLLMILSMQVMLRLNPRDGVLWIIFCALMMALTFARISSIQAIALVMVYSAGIVLLGFYALATRRAQEARLQNQRLAQQLQEANRQLTTYSSQLEQLGAAQERARLARDLHDSVTQTVFSMSLTAQSAGLLLERNSTQVKTQLERLGKLTQNALSEMKLLVSELHPTETGEGDLTADLKSYIQGHILPGDLSFSFQPEGQGTLRAMEQQALFRIVQEALNNVARHAKTTRVSLRLHLVEPFWIEVEDHGRGFDLPQALAGGGVGLKSMYERANGIGWILNIISSPGSGTRVRIEKPTP